MQTGKQLRILEDLHKELGRPMSSDILKLDARAAFKLIMQLTKEIHKTKGDYTNGKHD